MSKGSHASCVGETWTRGLMGKKLDSVSLLSGSSVCEARQLMTLIVGSLTGPNACVGGRETCVCDISGCVIFSCLGVDLAKFHSLLAPSRSEDANPVREVRLATSGTRRGPIVRMVQKANRPEAASFFARCSKSKADRCTKAQASGGKSPKNNRERPYKSLMSDCRSSSVQPSLQCNHQQRTPHPHLRNKKQTFLFKCLGATNAVAVICSAYRPNAGRCGELRPCGNAPGTASVETWLPKPGK